MRLKLTLLRPGGGGRDVVVTADAVASVRDIAGALASREPGRASAGAAQPHLTLQLHADDGEGRVLDPDTPLLDAPLAAGATVSTAVVGDVFVDPLAARGLAAALLTVVSGPDAGRQVELPLGTSTVGRDKRSDVALTDPLVSKRHARITVGEQVEIVDAGSSNGVQVGSGLVPRAHLATGDVAVLGDSEISVRLLPRAGGQGEASGSSIAFNRSPVLERRFAGEEVPAPEPPTPAQRQPLPVIALVAPLIMGLVLYAVTRSVLSLFFIGLSPLLALAGYLDTRAAARRQDRAEARGFADRLAAAESRLGTLAQEERASRLAEAPSTSELVSAVFQLAPLLWWRRPDVDGFLHLRLGLGRVTSRSSLLLPTGGRGRADHWASLGEAARRWSTLDAVPVIAPLAEVGVVGVSGRGASAAEVTAGLVAQLVISHSPAELVVAATTGRQSASGWEWLKWLPHTSSPSSPIDGSHLASGPSDGGALVARLEELAAERAAADGQDSTSGATTAGRVPAVILVVEHDSPVDRSRLVQLAENGPAGGVVVLWDAPETADLPAACRVVLEVGPGGGAHVGYIRTGERISPVMCEGVAPEVAHALARRLAPITDSGARVDDGSDLPRSISLLSLTGPELADDPAAVVGRWSENESIVARDARPVPRHRDATLRAVVGLAAGETFTLDLRTQGPHALVGGTTGAGKSEFLQSWVLSMAAAHSPDRVTFLLVDYKGGSAFGDCVRLPHCVGLVTDLSPHLVRRALTSLRAELRHREELLARAKKKDLLDMERSGDPATPPSLVIVVDEFAALVGEVPEFVDGVVDVAQRGRSLGLHLVLATQRPAGVIKGSLRANTNLRIALRMADEDDSTDVLGSSLAAGFDPGVPGRGAAKTGPGRLTLFQSGYVGGVTSAEPPPAQVDIHDLGFGVGAAWPPASRPDAATRRAERTRDITRLVDTVVAASDLAGITPPRVPWRPTLADGYDLEDLSQRSDRELVLGFADDPDHQDQHQIAFRPDAEGNIVVIGTGGSGKSTALRTLAVAAAITPRSGPVQVYALDFGAGGLAILDQLPHVGAVISGDDHERIARLLRMLKELVDDRSVEYASRRASTITEFRSLADRPDEPRILLLVDGLAAFRTEYEVGPRSRWFSTFQQIAADGRPVGVHVALSADRPGSVPSTLASSIQRRLVLRLADDQDYALVDVPADVLSSTSPPGRGVMDGLEVQVAVLGGSTSVSEQSSALDRLTATVRKRGLPPAPAVQRLPERVTLAQLPAAASGWPVLGVADDTLQPIGVDLRGVFLVAGPPASGRTTTMASIITSARRWRPGLRSYFLGERRSPLIGLSGWTEQAGTVDDVEELAMALQAELAGRDPSLGPVLVVVENVPDYLNGSAEAALQSLVAVCARQEHGLLADGETSVLNQSWGLLQTVRAGRRGLALQPEQTDGDAVFRTAFPRVARAEFPPGRGLLVARGTTTRVQVALPELA